MLTHPSTSIKLLSYTSNLIFNNSLLYRFLKGNMRSDVVTLIDKVCIMIDNVHIMIDKVCIMIDKLRIMIDKMCIMLDKVLIMSPFFTKIV